MDEVEVEVEVLERGWGVGEMVRELIAGKESGTSNPSSSSLSSSSIIIFPGPEMRVWELRSGDEVPTGWDLTYVEREDGWDDWGGDEREVVDGSSNESSSQSAGDGLAVGLIDLGGMLRSGWMDGGLRWR